MAEHDIAADNPTIISENVPFTVVVLNERESFAEQKYQKGREEDDASVCELSAGAYSKT